MGNTQKTGYLQNLIQYDGSGNIVLPGTLTISTNKLVATQEYVGTQVAALVNSAPSTLDTLNELAAALGNDPNFATTVAASIGSKVPTTRTLTINGTAYDLSADRSWTIVGGVSSFNTRTGAITLTDTDVTGALGYTPVTNARTLTINGTAYDLSADRSWTIGATSSARNIQTITADGTIATYTVTNGYVVGLVDVYRNGVKLGAADITATNGTTVTLGVTPASGDIIEIVNYVTALTQNNALRTVNTFNVASATNTFTVSYTQGLLDVYYNGSKLTPAEYTATNGTSVVLSTNAAVGSVVEIITYNYSVSGFSGVGFSGTPTTNYIPKWTASGVLGDSAISDNGTNITLNSRALAGTTATFSGNVTLGSLSSGGQGGINGASGTINRAIVNCPYPGASALTLGYYSSAYGLDIWVNGDGTGLAPAYIDQRNAEAIIFRRNTQGTAAESMRITGSGNVGIGTSSPSYTLDVQVNNSTFTSRIRNLNTTTDNAGLLVQAGVNAGNEIALFKNAAGTDRMAIYADGKICMNTTTATTTLNLKAQSDNRAIFFQNPNGADGSIWLYGASNSFDYKFSTWSQGSAFYLYNNGNYSFAGSNVSDRRLKQNIQSITYNAIEKIMQLVPKSYNMVAQPEINRNGFIAQEVKEVLPDVITGTETEEEYLGLDYNGLLAVAIKAIQELKAEVEQLKAK